MDEKENFQDTGPGTDREGIDEHDRRPEPEQAVAASAGNEPAAVLPEPKSDRAASQADAAGPRSESRPPERAPGEPSVGEPRTSKPGIENAPVPPPSEERLVQRTLNDILRLVGFRVRIDLVKRPDGYHANIRSRQSTGILIGHRGSTLRALQYLVRVMVRRTWPEVPPVTLDIGGEHRYTEAREGLRQHLQGDGLARARGAGDESVAVGHGRIQPYLLADRAPQQYCILHVVVLRYVNARTQGWIIPESGPSILEKP